MKITPFLTITAFILLSLFISAFDEIPFVTELKKKLATYHLAYPEEKIYVQTDKPFYRPGEDIWFSVFLVSANTHRPSHLSDVVYVQLIDPKGSVASQVELFQKEGATHGDFKLSNEAVGGIYQLKAFTRWIRNWGEAGIFKKEIQVQQINTPRLLLKLDFEKEAYGPGDSVKTKLTVSNLKTERVARARINYQVRLAGNTIVQSDAYTDHQGTATFGFDLPTDLLTADGVIHAVINDKGTEESISRSIPIVLNQISLKFFPEGGDLVENVQAKVGFKAVNEFGKGADVSGIIVDEKGNKVTDFESLHMGMGAFAIKPQSGRKYFAQITKPLGTENLVELPKASIHGFTLGVKEKTREHIELSIYSPAATKGYLVGQTSGLVYDANEVNLAAGINTVSVATAPFPAGIAVFTLFDYMGTERCERLVFLNGDKKLSIQLTTNKKGYQPREKVEVEVETKDNQGRPMPARIALSVVDDQLISFADDKQDHIISWLLLSSELKGEVQEPNFYFNPHEPKADQALDYLLMTQGWRRFTWRALDSTRLLTHTVEKENSISGWVESDQLSKTSEVTLLEINNKRRLAKVTVMPDGRFIFKNTDPTTPVLLLTKKPGQIIVQKNMITSGRPLSHVPNDKSRSDLFPVDVLATKPTTDENSGLDVVLTEDVKQLSEVVVVGYGMEQRRDLTGSVTSIRDSQLDVGPLTPVFETYLQGRVSGIQVQTQSGNPGSQPIVKIRGTSSITATRGEPLYVVDGVVIGNSLNSNFSTSSIVGIDNIASIEVMTSPEASAFYGSRAANGVIVITTKTHLGRSYNMQKKKDSPYTSIIVYPRQFSVTREFYSPIYTKNKNLDERTDFRTTAYWNPNIVTDNNGKAKLVFYNTDAITSFRLTAEGTSGGGLIGRQEETFYTQRPFSIDTRIPPFIGYEDSLRLPIRITNTTSRILNGQLKISSSSGLKTSADKTLATIPPQSSEIIYVTVVPKGIEGTFPINIRLDNEDFHDEIKQQINVHPVGFPSHISFSARKQDTTFQFNIHDAENGTVKAELTAFTDVLSDLAKGTESILREPHGCFEQVSSSTFPNILALQFLKQSGTIRPETENTANHLIEDGYKKLAAYEIKGGGFEWFGHPPAHEALSAYGLIEFSEMKKVFPKVDQSLINRTKSWLLSRRDGHGGFLQNAGKYGFAAAPTEVNNAYIVYALAESGVTEILPEYQQAWKEAWQSKDIYRMALVAIAAYDLNRKDDYEKLKNHFIAELNAKSPQQLNASSSIVRSYGNGLANEATGFLALALLKDGATNRTWIDECIKSLASNRSHGGFGSTQATTVSLQALTAYANLVRTTKEGGEINVMINGLIKEKLIYQGNEAHQLTMKNFGMAIPSDGRQNLRVAFQNTRDPLPISIDVQWYSKTPPAHQQRDLRIAANLAKSTIKVNEIVRLNVELRNVATTGLPMSMAVVGIPAGLSVQPWQLRELQEKHVFDFYEIIDDRVAFYYRELAPSAIVTISLDLKAEFPGTYTGVANSAYLYYDSERKDWQKGLLVKIEPK